MANRLTNKTVAEVPGRAGGRASKDALPLLQATQIQIAQYGYGFGQTRSDVPGNCPSG